MYSDFSLQTISLVLQIISSVVTIISGFFVFFTKKADEDLPPEETKYPLGHKVEFQGLKWIIMVSFVLYYFATIFLIVLDDVPPTALVSTLVTFAVMLLGFFLLLSKGKKSLKTRVVLAPKKLWQVMSNRIPSYLKECDGPFRIKIVKIGMYDEEDEKKDDDYQSGIKINDLVQKTITQIKEGKKGQTFLLKDDSLPLYEIQEYETPYYRSCNTDKIHGLIVFIGNRLSESKVRSSIDELADKYPDTPLGYVSYGTYPSDGYYPPYINLKRLRVNDYIDHLIFRYYARSEAWKDLSKTYHKSLVFVSILSTVLMASIPGGLLLRHYQAEQSRIFVAAPGTTDKGNFTKLVNYLLVSPVPLDVKLWERLDKKSAKISNTFRYAEEGNPSSEHDSSSMVAKVMETEVFLLYDKSRRIPYTVWLGDGTKCVGKYNRENNSYEALIGRQKKAVYQWVPETVEQISYDDKRIRLMYSNDGLSLVEVIYSPASSKAIRKALKHSPTFLFDIQRFLILSKLKGLFPENAHNMDISCHDSQQQL